MIYAVMILSASALTRHYAVEDPAASLVIIVSMFIAEGLYLLYRKIS